VKTRSKAKNISSVSTAAKTSETKINDKTSPSAFNSNQILGLFYRVEFN
jgi:hypothetical protein